MSDVVLDGRYRLEDQLGAGGMARVYQARDLRHHRDVAVKVFREDVADAVDPRRFERERQLLKSVHAPALVKMLDTSRPDSPTRYVVVELVRGAHLGIHLAHGRLEERTVRHIVADVADALAALHRLQVVHRDVKPANILLPDEAKGGPTAKLTDFGTARAVDGTRITAPASILGTPAYLSPEQVRGERVGTPTDVYALGLVLFECLTGGRAFTGPATEAALARLTRSPVVPDDVPQDLADLVLAMTASDPGARPFAEDVADALRSRRPLAALPATAGMAAPMALPAARVAPAAVPAVQPVAASMPLAAEQPAAGAPAEPITASRTHRLHRLPWYVAVWTGGVLAGGLTVFALSASMFHAQASFRSPTVASAAPALPNTIQHAAPLQRRGTASRSSGAEQPSGAATSSNRLAVATGGWSARASASAVASPARFSTRSATSASATAAASSATPKPSASKSASSAPPSPSSKPSAPSASGSQPSPSPSASSSASSPAPSPSTSDSAVSSPAPSDPSPSPSTSSATSSSPPSPGASAEPSSGSSG